MQILSKYLARVINLMLLYITLIILALDLFFYAINELRWLGQAQYTMSSILEFLALTIPRKLYLNAPWSCLLAVLLAGSQLAKQQELLAMRNAALSISNLALRTMLAITPYVLSILIIGETLMPWSEQQAQNLKLQALHAAASLNASQQTMLVKTPEGFVFISPTLVQSYTIQQQQLTSIRSSQHLQHQATGLALQQVTAVTLPTLTNPPKPHQNIKQQQLPHANIALPQALTAINAMSEKHLERLAIHSLYTIQKQRQAFALSNLHYHLAIWKKLFHPTIMYLMAYLAFSFLFGNLRSAKQGWRLLYAVILAFLFYTLQLVCQQLPLIWPWLPVAIAMALPLAMGSGFAYWCMHRRVT
jgi:lipopolysaccharide export system permease protein